MFCSKCGANLPDDAAFCQNCGTRLMPDLTPPPVPPQPASLEGLGALLQANMDRCPAVESVRQDKRGLTVKSGQARHYLRMVSGQISVTSGPSRFRTLCISIPAGIAIGLACVVVSSLAWDFMDYGRLYWEDYYYALLAAACFFAALSTLSALLLGGRKKRAEVESYIRTVAAENGVPLLPDKQKSAGTGPKAVMLLLLILAGAALVVVPGALDGGGGPADRTVNDREDGDDVDDGDDEKEEEPVILTKTFGSESNGFGFLCPSGWETEDPADIDPDLILSAAQSGAFGTYARITVTKTANDGSLDELSAADLDVIKEIYLEEPTIKAVDSLKLRNTKLGGRDAKKITASVINNEDVSCVLSQYLYCAGTDIYYVTCMYAEDYADKYEPIVDAILDSYTITAPEAVPYDPAASEYAAAMAAYADTVRALDGENDSQLYALIDLTGSEVPALAAGLSGYYVSIYMWDGSEVVTVADCWPYGAGGNYGYEYLPGQNIIRNFNSDMAGAIVYEFYMRINTDYEVEWIGDGDLSTWYFRDLNGNYYPDENEPFLDEPIYYYGDVEISAEDYASFQFNGDYQWLDGDQTASEILAVLEG